MAMISKPFRLVNPGRKRRKVNGPKRLTLKQKLHFGTKRQRAAAKLSLRGKKKTNTHYLGKVGKGLKSLGGKPGYIYTNRGKKIRKNVKYVRAVGTNYSVIRPGQRTASHGTKQGYLYTSNPGRKRKKKKNVGSILTVFNPGSVVTKKKRSNMARSAKRRRAGLKAARTRRRKLMARRSNPVRHRRYSRRRGNPVARRSRRRYARVARRHRRYGRRNPGMFSGTVGKVVGVVGGAAVTKMLSDVASGMVPMIASGIPGYVASAVIAFLQGKVVGKLLKNPSLGSDMAVGGYTYVALKVLNDFLPSFGNPFGMSGMGLLTSSNNWGPPWQNVPNSMTRFVKPGGMAAGIPMAAPSVSGIHGLGRLRRVGRLA